MISLYIQDGPTRYQVGLRANTKINFSVYNPMFSDAGAWSQMFNIDKLGNEKFFKYVTSIDTIEYHEFKFSLQLGADVTISGIVVIIDSDEDNIQLYLKSGNSNVANFLKNNIMSDSTWLGSYTTTSGNFSETLYGTFPEFPMLVPQVTSADGDVIFNKQTTVKSTAAVYLRYILDKLITELDYIKASDWFTNDLDFNRLCIFTGVKEKGGTSRRLWHYCPNISFQEFLKSLQIFNVFVFFSPTTFEAEILNIEDIFALTPLDYTHKFKRYKTIPPATQNQFILEYDTEDSDDKLTHQELSTLKDGDVATVDDLPGTAEGSVYYVTAEDRYYIRLLAEDDDPFYTPGSLYWREYGRLSSIKYGNPSTEDQTNTITSKGKIAFNKYVYNDLTDAVYEFPRSNFNEQNIKESKDFEWLVYRGTKLHEGINIASYCNYDDRDLTLKDYMPDMQVNFRTPTLTLQWRGDKALSRFFANRLPWERYLKRRVILELELNYVDAFDTKIYRPFSINGSNFITEYITFSLDVYGNVTNQQVYCYTL